MGAGHTHALYVHEHSRVHGLAPEVKLVAAFVFVVVVATTPRELVPAFLGYAVVLAAVTRLGRVPFRFLLKRLLIIVPFVLFALLLPFVAGGERIDVLGVGLSTSGLWGTWNILAKASLGAATSILLASTTEIADLLRGLERLRVPVTLTTIAMFMVRYLAVIAGEVERTRTAMAARSYDPRWLWQARPIAASAGALFIRSYERGERVHAAMRSRGFTGTMPDLHRRRAAPAEWAAAALLPAVAVALRLVTSTGA